MMLKNYLDDASAAWLQGKMEMDSDLSYYNFWEELKSKFTRDARAVHRQNWRAVKVTLAGSKVTLQEWSKFQAIYTTKRSMVEDWSDAEDQQHVFSQVPSGLQIKVLNETQKRRHDKKWVRVVVPPGMTVQEIMADVEQELGAPLHLISEDKRHFVLACSTDNEVRKLLELDGGKIGQQVLRVQRAEYSMTGDEMLTYVRRLLETGDELDSLRRSYGCEVPDQPKVHVVQAAPSPSGGNVQGAGPQGSRGRTPSIQRKAGQATREIGRIRPAHRNRHPSGGVQAILLQRPPSQ